MRTAVVDHGKTQQVLGVGASAIGCLVVGSLAVSSPGLAAATTIVVVGVAVALAGPGPLLLAIFPAVFVARRVGPASLNMSVADVVLVASALVGLSLVPWRSAHVRRVATAMGTYLALLLVTVVASPSQRALLEWAHRASFLLGGLVVGAAIGHLGQSRQALRAFLVGSVVVSSAAVLQSVGTGFSPAYPLGLHKNFAGALLVMSIVVVHAAPTVVGGSRRSRRSLEWFFVVGVLATQSRGALLGLVVAIVLWSVIMDGRAARMVVMVPAAAVIVVIISLSIQADATRSDSDFTPENSRRISYNAAMKAWRQDPIFGSGLRYYRAPGYRFDVPSYRNTYIEPHSVWYVTLGESGLVGLGALGLLVALSLRAMRHIGGPLALAAALVIVAKLAHGMVDIYWVAGTQTLPWLLVGMAATWQRPGTPGSEGPESALAGRAELVAP